MRGQVVLPFALIVIVTLAAVLAFFGVITGHAVVSGPGGISPPICQCGINFMTGECLSCGGTTTPLSTLNVVVKETDVWGYSGTITSDLKFPAMYGDMNINCSGDGFYYYSDHKHWCFLYQELNKVVTLTATPDQFSDFGSWTGCTPTLSTPDLGKCTVSMPSTVGTSKSVTATFVQRTTAKRGGESYTLGVLKRGAGTGSITSSPAGISMLNIVDDSVYKSADFKQGDTVTLTATPVAGSTFEGWSYGCAAFGKNPVCTLTGWPGSDGVWATFSAAAQVLPDYRLTVTAPTGGKITSDVGGIDCGCLYVSNGAGVSCGSTCSATFKQGTAVMLTATSRDNSFSSWTGIGCVNNICRVPMDANKNLGVVFSIYQPAQYRLEVAKGGDCGGTVTTEDGKVSCGAACSVLYPEGSRVRLTVTPNTGCFVENLVNCERVNNLDASAGCTFIAGSTVYSGTVSVTFRSGPPPA
ncbi:MAG: hypothetical protein V1887_01395, partial [Candidatus Aenigmatarchaeota archaeon]